MCSEKAAETCHHLHNVGHDVLQILAGQRGPELDSSLLERLMRGHRAEQAVDAHSAHAALVAIQPVAPDFAELR